MNSRVYLALPPNITRRAREIVSARFPEADIGAIDSHQEMFAFASGFGEKEIPGLSVSAYPQMVLRAVSLDADGRLASPDAGLPPLREEFVSLGMTPPARALRIISVVPGVLAAAASLSHRLEDWIDLCSPDFPGPVGCPPADTPMPYLVETLFGRLAGEGAQNLLKKLDTHSNPIDINKRVASGELKAALIIPAFARTFRAGGGRMIWPKSGALAVPVVACLAADAAPVARAVLAWLLSDEFQRVIVSDGVIAPAVPGVRGFDELEASGWNLLWPGWDLFLSVAEAMCAANLYKETT
ncbi:MAG: ABC transporter substrate-binding protein [Desulfovibrio sp.]|jgi:hypothetical protein|nr:ABC transporter substrate-binding protein [Desulfovibrio sp.]